MSDTTTPVMPRGTYEIPVEKLVTLIQEAADQPSDPVVVVRHDTWGMAVLRIVSIQREDDGRVVIEIGRS